MTLKELSQANALNKIIERMSSRPVSPTVAPRLQEYIAARDRITAYLDGIADPLAKKIFRCRFIEQMRWADVAAAVGGGNTVEGVKKVCYRYLLKHPENAKV